MLSVEFKFSAMREGGNFEFRVTHTLPFESRVSSVRLILECRMSTNFSSQYWMSGWRNGQCRVLGTYNSLGWPVAYIIRTPSIIAQCWSILIIADQFLSMISIEKYFASMPGFARHWSSLGIDQGSPDIVLGWVVTALSILGFHIKVLEWRFG